MANFNLTLYLAYRPVEFRDDPCTDSSSLPDPTIVVEAFEINSCHGVVETASFGPWHNCLVKQPDK